LNNDNKNVDKIRFHLSGKGENMAAPSEMTVVMVDDNSDEIFLTRRQVRRDGIVNAFVSERHPERLMETLSELIEHGAEPQRLLMLLDIKMPRIDGFETLKTIRKDSRFKDMPVIMLSASDDESDMFEALELGASGYIVKPFKADEFFAALTCLPQVKYRLVQ
jgi:two-component system, response regulator